MGEAEITLHSVLLLKIWWWRNLLITWTCTPGLQVNLL